MDPIRICHCGKCKVTCCKHGLRATCAECGKRRILGTQIKDGKVRYICDQCCTLLMAEQKLKDEREELEFLKKIQSPEWVKKKGKPRHKVNERVRMEYDLLDT